MTDENLNTKALKIVKDSIDGMKYTLEQFELDMENASIDQMDGFLTKAVDCFDVSDPIVRETLLKYKEDLQDIREQMDLESDADISKGIEKGKFKLYKCIKDISWYNVGQNYYVHIDNPADFLSQKTISEVAGISDEASKYISSIAPLAWIVKDRGLGTLKKKYMFGLTQSSKGIDADFSEYFEILK